MWIVLFLLFVVLLSTDIVISDYQILPQAHICSLKYKIFSLRGGSNIGSPESAGQRTARMQALWDKCMLEWQYCTAVDCGRALEPEIDREIPDLPDELYDNNYNWDGMHPPPDIWKKPTEEDIKAGFQVNTKLCPIPELVKDVERQLAEEEEEERQLHRDGPQYEAINPIGSDGKPINIYWDTTRGTRPFPNVRDSLPPGWRQVKVAGSCFILDHVGNFVHCDDHRNQDVSTWGAEEADRGRWWTDKGTWEESDFVYLQFFDQDQTLVTLQLHCEDKFIGQPWAYTGEDVRDGWIDELHKFPNVYQGRGCADPDCSACREISRTETPPSTPPETI